MVLKNKRIFYLIFLALIVLLSGCNNNGKTDLNDFYLSLTGDSENWDLKGYEVVISPENLKAGNGTLHMKNKNEYIADSIHFKTHAVINGEDIVVHSGSASGAGIDIANESTGAIEGEGYLNEGGNPITLKEVSNIYMTVEWLDTGKSESMKERINLYNKSNKENSFLE